VLFSYSQSAEFVSMCYDFDIAVNICTIRDIRRKISDHFSCVVTGNMNNVLVVICTIFRTGFYLLSLLHCMYCTACHGE